MSLWFVAHHTPQSSYDPTIDGNGSPLHNTNDLILLDSTVTSSFHFTNKRGFSKLIVEGCIFKKAFTVYTYSHLGGESTDVPDLVSIASSEFEGDVDMVPYFYVVNIASILIF